MTPITFMFDYFAFNMGQAVLGLVVTGLFIAFLLFPAAEFPSASPARRAFPLLFVDSLFSASKQLMFAPPSKYRESKSLSKKKKKKMFFLGSCPNFEQNPTVIFFSCFVTSGT